MSLTLKADTGFDAPWISVPDPTLDGLSRSPEDAAKWQREYLLALFNLEDSAEHAGLSTADLLVSIAVHYKGLWAAAHGLGAQPLPQGKAPAAKPAAAKKAPAKAKPDVNAPAPTYTATTENAVPDKDGVVAELEREAPAEAVAENPDQVILDALEQCFTKKDVQKLVLSEEGKVAFAKPEMQKAAQARVKKLAAV